LKVEFKSSFAKDLRKISDSRLKKQIKEVIETVEQANDFRQLENMKQIKGASHYYRIKIGDYRVGLIIEMDLVIFVRFLHRKDIYRYFP